MKWLKENWIEATAILVLLVGVGFSINSENEVNDKSVQQKNGPASIENREVLISDNSESENKRVYVKYGGYVNVGHSRFEFLDTTGSSFIKDAWYDDSSDYMVIGVSDTYYHYCGMPDSVWNSFENASSFGSFYGNRIKDKYDCRYNPTPNYIK